MSSGVDRFYQGRQFGHASYFPGALGQSLGGVSVGILQDGVHAEFQCGIDVFVDTISDVHYVLGPLTDPLGGDLEDSRVGFAEIELVRIHPNAEEIQYAYLFEMLLERMAAYESVGEYTELEPQFFKGGESLLYFRLDRGDLAQRFVPEPRKMPPLLAVERDTLSLAKTAQESRGVEIVPHYVGDKMPDPQRYQVCPAITLEAADRLTTTLEIVIRQSRALAEYSRGAESAEVQQGLAKSNSTALIIDSDFSIVDPRF